MLKISPNLHQQRHVFVFEPAFRSTTRSIHGIHLVKEFCMLLIQNHGVCLKLENLTKKYWIKGAFLPGKHSLVINNKPGEIRVYLSFKTDLGRVTLESFGRCWWGGVRSCITLFQDVKDYSNVASITRRQRKIRFRSVEVSELPPRPSGTSHLIWFICLATRFLVPAGLGRLVLDVSFQFQVLFVGTSQNNELILPHFIQQKCWPPKNRFPKCSTYPSETLSRTYHSHSVFFAVPKKVDPRFLHFLNSDGIFSSNQGQYA